MLIVLSLTVSCRYIWWRYTSTLNWDDPVSPVCGVVLLFAETYAGWCWCWAISGDMAIESPAGSVTQRYGRVADGGYFRSHLQ